LRDCRQCELELGTAWPTQAQTTQPKDTLEMCKQHLDTFAIAARSLEPFSRASSFCAKGNSNLSPKAISE
jgi:hypothetical protein